MTNYQLNKSDINTLKRYEIHLKRAKDGYVRGLYSVDLDVLEPIYAKFGMHLENRHCSTCVLGMLKFLENKYNTK
jgi:hypothetical protein